MTVGHVMALGIFAVLSIVAYKLMSKPSEVLVTKIEGGKTSRGLRFYRPDHYLLVADGKDGQSTVSVIALPNTKEEYEVYATPGWSKVDLKVTLDGGWNLTSLGASTEPQAPTMVTSLGGLVTKEAFTAQAGEGAGRPTLYRIEFGGDGKASKLVPVPIPSVPAKS